jgi:gliding motility-associated-like protein
MIVEVHPQPQAAFSFSPLNPELNGVVQFQDASTNALNWYWSFGDGESSTLQNPSHQFTSIDNFPVVLVVSNHNCIDSVLINLIIEEDLIFYVPNAFTPNEGEYNNNFTPVFTSGYDPNQYRLTIFNRWGEIIFESHDTNYGWDGSYQGLGIVQDGTYIWKIELKEKKSSKKHLFTGHVTVLR